jgi:hypothetical protein
MVLGPFLRNAGARICQLASSLTGPRRDSEVFKRRGANLGRIGKAALGSFDDALGNF